MFARKKLGNCHVANKSQSSEKETEELVEIPTERLNQLRIGCASQAFSQGIPNDPNYPLAFICQQQQSQGIQQAQGISGQGPGQSGHDPKQSGRPGNKPASRSQGSRQSGAPRTVRPGQKNLHGNQRAPRPTVRPSPGFSPKKDAETIKNAMKDQSARTDEQAIIHVLCQRSNQQRVEIAEMFKNLYGKDLIEDLELELSGNFEEMIMAMLKPTAFYDAWSLHKAIGEAGMKEGVLIEVLCTRTDSEIREINNSYREHYKRTLEDIVSNTSGHFKPLLASCCQANRAELTAYQWAQLQQQGPETVVDRALAQQDAEALHQAGKKKLGTEESAFHQVLETRHYFQLCATFEEYEMLSDIDILSWIKRELSGDLEEEFTDIVMCSNNRPEYFAEKLKDAMKGGKTNDSALIRIVVTRSEIDLQDIKEVFYTKYYDSLATVVAEDTSGDYKDLLLALIVTSAKNHPGYFAVKSYNAMKGAEDQQLSFVSL